MQTFIKENMYYIIMPVRKIVNLSDEQGEWLDAQPRSFNMSKFVREAIDAKRVADCQNQ